MGTNKRYPSRIADDIAARVPQAVSRPRPVSLSDAELDKENTRVTTAPEPIPVRAWVRYPEAPVRTVARALAWTPRAVLIEWESPNGGTTRAWVWASAVERLNSRPEHPPGNGS